MILASLQKLPKNVKDLGKFIVAKGFKKLPKVQKSPTLVTLAMVHQVFFKHGPDPASFLFYFHPFCNTMTIMVPILTMEKA